MNVDAINAFPAPMQKADAGPSRHRAVGDAAADGPGTASFMSMLLALGPPIGDPGWTGVDGVTPSGRGLGPGDGEATAHAGADGTDGGTVPLKNPVPAASALALPDAASTQGTATNAVSASDALADVGRASAFASDTKDLQASRAASDATADTSARKQLAAAADASTLARRQVAEVGTETREEAGRADTAAAAREAKDESTWRMPATPQSGSHAASVVSMLETGRIGLRAGPGGRMQERGATRVGDGPGSAHGGFVPWLDAGPGNNVSQAASTVYAPTAATPVPASALAQKLHFWVAGGVQSAELQLEAFDGGSIDVHIAVKGGEAYVEFRSDQPQARKLLLEAMPHLKDLLAGEGLTLSGGFVGGSAQHQGDGASARRDRFSGSRTGQESVVAGPSAAAPSSVRATVGSAVDLFV